MDRTDAGDGTFLSGHMIKMPQVHLVCRAGDHMGAVGHPGSERGGQGHEFRLPAGWRRHRDDQESRQVKLPRPRMWCKVEVRFGRKRLGSYAFMSGCRTQMCSRNGMVW